MITALITTINIVVIICAMIVARRVGRQDAYMALLKAHGEAIKLIGKQEILISAYKQALNDKGKEAHDDRANA